MVYDFFEELKDILKRKIKYLYSEFKYVLLVLILIALVLAIYKCKIKNPENVETQQIYVHGISVENWAQWIATIAIPYTAGWAIFQFKKSSIAKKQEKAVQIAREFSGNLIDKCGIVNQVYTMSSLNEILKFDEKNYDDFKFFNTDELRRIYKSDDFPTEYQTLRIQKCEELDNIYHYILLRRVTPYSVELVANQKDTESNETESKKDRKKMNPFILQNANLPYHFADLESEVLNQLEYMCMDISSKATDSNFIYQSLHQMFLRTVRTLAAEISVDNYNYSDKYYINIIHVYNEWTTRYIRDSKLEKRKKEKTDKILNPKIKTV